MNNRLLSLGNLFEKLPIMTHIKVTISIVYSRHEILFLPVPIGYVYLLRKVSISSIFLKTGAQKSGMCIPAS